LEDVGRLTVRLVMQQAIEAEVDAFLGRGRHERRAEDARSGSRNGWQPAVAVKTTMGPIELKRPKLRDTEAVQRQGHSGLLGEAMARVAERRGRRIAKVAAARRLLSFVFYALRDGELRCLASAR
jgi:hypothetical protein